MPPRGNGRLAVFEKEMIAVKDVHTQQSVPYLRTNGPLASVGFYKIGSSKPRIKSKKH